MAGRNSKLGGGGCSSGRGGRKGCGCSYNNSNSRSTKVGLCKDLESNIFDFRMMTCNNLMQMTQEKVVLYAASTCGGNIANELKNWTRVVINHPNYSNHIQVRHRARISMVRA